jgi:hypothetical protein
MYKITNKIARKSLNRIYGNEALFFGMVAAILAVIGFIELVMLMKKV